ncbi:MAG: cobalamin-binding protein, partial [Proteobacteria bacterium]|nr:cobalamin-binding protein [Pseudomonadota bacterium]
MGTSLNTVTSIAAVAKPGMGNLAMFLLAAFTQSLLAMEPAKTESGAVAAIDDEGSLVQLAAPAKRIISLAPSLTELIYAAGAGDKLVGVIAYSNYPEAAKSLPVVGQHDMLDMERILSLRPDLVVAWLSGNPRASVRRLRELGLNVYIAEPKNLESIPSHMERLAILAGTESIAKPAAENFRSRLRALDKQYRNKAAVRTFYQVWDKPLISAGGNELINDIISLCGGNTIFSDIDRVSPTVS